MAPVSFLKGNSVRRARVLSQQMGLVAKSGETIGDKNESKRARRECPILCQLILMILYSFYSDGQKKIELDEAKKQCVRKNGRQVEEKSEFRRRV